MYFSTQQICRPPIDCLVRASTHRSEDQEQAPIPEAAMGCLRLFLPPHSTSPCTFSAFTHTLIKTWPQQTQYLSLRRAPSRSRFVLYVVRRQHAQSDISPRSSSL